MRTLLLASLSLWLGTAPADTPTTANVVDAAPLELWLPGTNAWGSRGGMHLDAAHGLRAHAFVISAVAEVGHATSLFASGDSALFNRERLALAWAPIRGLDLGLSEAFIYSRWSTYVDANVAIIGDPTLHVKYTRDIDARWALGAALTWLVPSTVDSANLAFKASTFTLAALGSFKPSARWELGANLGFVFDDSSRLGSAIAPDKRFVYQVNAGSGALAGLSALSHWKAANTVGLMPFVEVGGLLHAWSDFSSNPLQLTAGLKTYLLHASFFELTVGADIRLTGAPQAGGDYPGLYPWMAFAALSAHIFDSPPEPTYAAQPCDDDDACSPNQRCINHYCSYVTEVVKEVTRVKVVKGKSFTVVGTVVDAELKRPIEGAQVLFAGFERTPVAVDLRTGKYRSFPLDAGDGLLRMRVIAPNYKPAEQVVSRSVSGGQVTVDIVLSKAERPDMGTLRGSLKDARTGKPLVGGKVVLVTLSKSMDADDAGLFSAQVPAGHHDVLVGAPGYVTQHKRISVHDADVIILNVDMHRTRKKHAPDVLDTP